MEIQEFIASVEKMNFSLTVKEGKLILKGDKKKLSSEEIDAIRSNNTIIDYIKDHKEELIEYLSSSSDISLKKNNKNVGSVYRLSGLQQGMLFHGLYNENSGSYVEQISCDLVNLNREALVKSWAEVIKRHTALRSAFYYDSFSVPVQCDYNEVTLPIENLDYQRLDEATQQTQLETFRIADRSKGFDFKAPPLMRVALIRLDEMRYHMVWTSHHILYDGWSTPILMGELLNTYECLISSQSLPSVVEDRYEDYIRYLERRDINAEELYWRNYLKGVDSGTLLPFISSAADRNKKVGTHRIQTITIDENITARIQDYVKFNHITVNTLIQGVWAWLLTYYTNSNDVVYGVVVSGRPDDLPGIEHRVGMYINTLPLRAVVKENQDTIKWLQTLQNDQVASRQYQYAALHDMQQWTNVKTDLFDSLLIFENYPVSKLLSSKTWSLKVENVHFQEQTNYPLTVMVTSAKKLTIALNYNTDLLEDFYISSIQKHFEQVLVQIANGNAETLKEIEPLTTLQNDQLIKKFNDTAVDYPKDETVVSLFEKQVELLPKKTAVVFENEYLSYEDLDKRSNKLAHHLIKRGVLPETMVPICLERSIEMIVGILGILKAGGSYVPIDPKYPAERIQFMLDDTSSRLILTDETSGIKSSPELTAINLTTNWYLIDKEPDDKLGINIHPDYLAYVIYTSGSTGLPKGVMIEHQSLINRLFWAQKYFNIDSTDNILQKTTFCFDVSVWELLLPFLSGASLIFCKPGGQTDNSYLKSIVDSQKITMMHFVPSMLSAFMLDIESGDCKSLKDVICSGEALNASQADVFRLKLPNVRLTNLYGPTEAAIDVSYWSLPDDNKPISIVPIGKPLDNNTLLILNKQGEPVPIGVPGELYISGIQVARGYLNRSELTSERFIINHLSDDPKARLYRTGDLTKWLPNGDIEYLGRLDDQVKIRGYRVELGEIENVLERSGLVKQAVVLAREDNQGIKRLIAYVVPKADFDKSITQSYLKAKLPEYMVPMLWVELETIPLTSNGKVDKNALYNADITESSVKTYVAPRNDTEQALSSIWKELLGLELISVNANFFEIGGHSLSAIRLVSAVRRQMQKELTIKDVFANSTIEMLANHFDQVVVKSITSDITSGERPLEIPLSYSQERLWFIDRLDGSSHYHVPTVLRLSGKLDKAALSYALKTVVDRHEILRTVYNSREGRAYQQITSAADWQLNISTILAAEQGTAKLQAQISELVSRPFDLSRDAMLRADLLLLSDEESLLVMTLHHIASDGWSSAIMVEELLALYTSFTAGEASPLKPLEIQYADYAIWQRKQIAGEMLAAKTAYWQQKLEGVSALQLPTDYPRPAVQGSRGAALNIELGSDLSARLNQLSKAAGTTLFMTLLSAFKVLLYRYSGQEDICVGTPIAGRQQKELEGLIGFFVNTLALRSQVLGDRSFNELLKDIKQTTLEAYEHQEVPFEKVVDAVVKTRDLSRSPLFQVMFIMQNTPEKPEIRIGGLQLTAEQHERTTSKFDLSLFLTETPEGLKGNIEYNTDLYGAETIKQMAAHLKELLKAIVTEPEQKIALLPMLNQAEKHQLLDQFNATETIQVQTSVTELFEAQAAKSENDIALIYKNSKLSYRQLNDKANQLAHYLQKRGISNGALVPLLIERGFEMVIGILGIQKAGGAYVPIDPDFPQDRIRYLLEDIKADIIITNINNQNKIPASAAEKIRLDADWNQIELEQSTNLDNAPLSERLAYIIYTSGSTGKPKGVMVTHGNAVNYLLNSKTRFIDQNANCTGSFMQLSYTFDASITAMLLPLLSGKAVVLSSKNGLEVFEDENLLKYAPYDFINITPAHLELLSGKLKISENRLLTSKLVIGGEALLPRHFNQMLTQKLDIEIINLYGPTEATIGCSTYSFYPLREASRSNFKSLVVPIGKPIDNTKIYILNSGGDLVPIGVAGEICVSGAQIAKGYLNNSMLTNEKFIKDPFSDDGTSIIYKTGDLGRWLPDGNIEYLGRSDNQVKIRGYRIELEEIESVLAQSGQVHQGIVIAKLDGGGNKQLIGYVVPNETFDKKLIYSYLSERLPSYMIPGLWVELNSFSLTVSGKINRKALPDPDFKNTQREYVAPRNETEVKLAQIWQELLKIDRISMNDDFFELGGHSLLLMRVSSYIEMNLSLNIPINVLFQFSNISDLAKYVEIKTKPQPQEENHLAFKFLDV